MIQTSYFAKMAKMTEEEKRRCISIVAYPPTFISPEIKNINELAPNKKTLWDYKKTNNEDMYYISYMKQLKELTFKKIIDLIPDDVILVCYETPDKFCHRHILAEFLNKYGISVEEYI